VKGVSCKAAFTCLLRLPSLHRFFDHLGSPFSGRLGLVALSAHVRVEGAQMTNSGAPNNAAYDTKGIVRIAGGAERRGTDTRSHGATMMSIDQRRRVRT